VTTLTDDSIKKRGRPKKNSTRDTQHSIWLDPDLWEAAGSLPISRPDIVRNAFMNAISFYDSDLPKLRWQLEEIRVQKMDLEAKETVIINRIAELEEEVKLFSQIQENDITKKENAVNETLRLCNVFGKKMAHTQFSIISDVSGEDPAKIESFLKDHKFRPNEDEVRNFFDAVIR